MFISSCIFMSVICFQIENNLSELQRLIIQRNLDQLLPQVIGLPYEFGGDFRFDENGKLHLRNRGVDCSGLPYSIVKTLSNNQINIPRTTAGLFARASIHHPGLQDLMFLDVLVFRMPKGNLHAGLYLGSYSSKGHVGSSEHAVLMAFKPGRPVGFISLSDHIASSKWWKARLIALYRVDWRQSWN